MTAETIQAAASVATFLAACLAVWATFRAPNIAAKFAESLRVTNQKMEEQHRLKMFVFTTLMQFRRQILNPNAVSALNLIDVVFRESSGVRDAWRSFSAATWEKPASSEKIIERYNVIVERMARDLGLSDQITIADIQNSYYPEALGHIDEATLLEAQEKVQRLRTPATSPTVDVA